MLILFVFCCIIAIMINTNTQYQSKALRLVGDFSDDIRNGKYQIDAPLPSENNLAEDYGVSRSTIRRVISLLTTKGDLFREPHKGVWINNESNTAFKMSANDENGQYNNKQAYSLAAVWAAVPDALTVGISEGIKKYAKEHNLAFQMFTSEEGHEKVLETFEHIEDYGVDGIIVLPYENDEYKRYLNKLADKKFPVVCVDRSLNGSNVSSVEVDNAYGMYFATNHLIINYHRPVYFFGPETTNRPQKQRYDGYCRAMVDAGFDELNGYTVNYEATDTNPEYWPIEKKMEKPFNRALDFLRNVELPVSIVCLNDYAARGIYQAASKLDLNIGDDIKIIGFDDLPMARCMNPALSSVLQPRMRIGYEAAGMLHKILSGKLKKPINISLPVELIERESS